MSENRLKYETSPYLLQHKDNPVHWWAWGPEAQAEAKRTGKPILLSVGYAACHWCHVMAHESFEDSETSAVMNDLFVNIKVDREERPDVDAIYMGALHRLGQRGGWPLTMFLDADGRPFWGGTYFPKQPMYGQPAFTDVLQQVAKVYTEQAEKVAHNAEALTGALTQTNTEKGQALTDAMIKDLCTRIVRVVDLQHGGINGAPKFPQWCFFWLLWRGAIRYRLPQAKAAVETLLTHICQGGIYDHLGGGFARYAVDERWLVPHFEKMLYDNALLVDLITDVWRETQDPLLRSRVEETIVWLLREMVAEGGGFAASLDADSDGEEGKFYVWSWDEIVALLGQDDAAYFGCWYDAGKDGNWEDKIILNRLNQLEQEAPQDAKRLATLRQKLLSARDKRVRPGWDDKVLADWNGLMIAALARSARVFEQPDWLAAAENAFRFIVDNMFANGRLHHAFRKGRTTAPATASDYANMIWAALRLHQATLRNDYLKLAADWTDLLDRHYWSDAAGGYLMSADDTEDVIVRLRSAADDATPNANAVMVSNLSLLSLMTGNTKYSARAEAILAAFSADVANNLVGHAGMVAASLDILAPQQIVIAATETKATAPLQTTLNSVSMPGALEYVLDLSENSPLPDVLADKRPINGRATAYCCLGPRCSSPVTTPEDLAAALRDLRTA